MLMNAQELIKKYDIRLAMKWIDGQHVPDGRLYIADGVRAKRNGDFDAIVAAKPEIVSILTAELEAKRRAEAEREAKIAAIPGLVEIQAALDDVDKWRSEFERSFADVGGLGVRPRPQYDFDALYAKYPPAQPHTSKPTAWLLLSMMSKLPLGVRRASALSTVRTAPRRWPMPRLSGQRIAPSIYGTNAASGCSP